METPDPTPTSNPPPNDQPNDVPGCNCSPPPYVQLPPPNPQPMHTRNPLQNLPPFPDLGLIPDTIRNPAPNPTPNPTPTRRSARKKPPSQGPPRKPQKAGPQSRQGKRIHDIFGAPLKMYNPRRDARVRAQEKARKNGATPEEVNAAGCRKLRRSHSGSTFSL